MSNQSCTGDWKSSMCVRVFPNAQQGFPFHSGCSLDVAFTVATVRNRPQPSATIRNHPQPSATVRNRPREACMAVPMASSAKVVTFGGFKCRVASFRVAGVGLCDIPTCFITCPKLSCVASAILFATFSELVFCESHCQGCVKW